MCDLLLSRVTKTSKNSVIMAPTKNKPSWKHPHTALKNYILYYGPGLRDNCTDFQKKYLAHVRASFGANVVRSRRIMFFTVTEAPDRITTKQFEQLDAFDQAEWKDQMRRYQEEKSKVMQMLQRCYSILFGSCRLSLKNKLRAHPEYLSMIEYNKESCGALYRIVNDLCNGAGRTLNCTLTMLDTVYYNMHLIKGSEYSGLSE